MTNIAISTTAQGLRDYLSSFYPRLPQQAMDPPRGPLTLIFSKSWHDFRDRHSNPIISLKLVLGMLVIASSWPRPYLDVPSAPYFFNG